MDLRLQPAVDAYRSRVDAAAPDLRPVHPQLPARGALQLRRRDQRCRDLARRHGSVQLQLRRRAHRRAVAVAVRRRARAAGCGSTTTCSPLGSWRRRSSGYPASTLVVARRLPAHSALLASSRRTPTTAGRVVTLGAQQSGFNTGRAPAVLQPAVRADPHLGARRPHHGGRLRLASAASDRGQRRLARRGVRVRRHLHAGVEHGGQSVRAGHRLVHAGPAAECVVHRGPSGAGLHHHQPRLLRPRRLARRRTPHAQCRRALRPRTGPDRSREPQHARLRLLDTPIRSRRRRRRSTPPILPRACRSRRLSSPCSAATSTSTTTNRASGMPTRTISSRGLDSPTRSHRPSSSVAARAVHLAVPDQRGARSWQPRQSAGLCTSDAGAGDGRQRADVPGESDQPSAERPATAAGGILASV